MVDEVKFEATIGKWVCVKKQTILPGSLMDGARILASVHDSLDRKIWEFLKEDIPLEKLDALVNEITGAAYNEKKKVWELKGRKSEAQIAEALAKCNSPTITKKMSEFLPVNKYANEIAKAYLTRKTIDMLGIRIELDPEIAEKFMDEKIKLKGL